MFNRIILIGNATRDTEVNYTTSGTAVATISLAVNSTFKKNDEKVEKVLFIKCKVFGRQAESCGHYLLKGNPVLIEGRLEINEWEKDGVKKSSPEVIASTKKGGERRGQGRRYPGRRDGP